MLITVLRALTLASVAKEVSLQAAKSLLGDGSTGLSVATDLLKTGTGALTPILVDAAHYRWEFSWPQTIR